MTARFICFISCSFFAIYFQLNLSQIDWPRFFILASWTVAVITIPLSTLILIILPSVLIAVGIFSSRIITSSPKCGECSLTFFPCLCLICVLSLSGEVIRWSKTSWNYPDTVLILSTVKHIYFVMRLVVIRKLLQYCFPISLEMRCTI